MQPAAHIWIIVRQSLISIQHYHGSRRHLSAQLWFATTLRDGIAISAAGGFATFRDIASAIVKQLLAKAGCSGNSEEAAATVIKGFEEVQPHSDVLPGLQAIHSAGIEVGKLICSLLPPAQSCTARLYCPKSAVRCSMPAYCNVCVSITTAEYDCPLLGQQSMAGRCHLVQSICSVVLRQQICRVGVHDDQWEQGSDAEVFGQKQAGLCEPSA